MVKVVKLSQEEIAEREKQSKLIKIAGEIFGNSRVSGLNLGLSIKKFPFLPRSYIFMSFLNGMNVIEVEKPKYLEEALQLAYAYEKAGFGEFTVKKQYEE